MDKRKTLRTLSEVNNNDLNKQKVNFHFMVINVR